jgi:predicted membrane protein
MNLSQRLSRVFASESIRVVLSFLGILLLLSIILVVLATIAAAYTGDWSLPGAVAVIILYVVLRTLLIGGLVFGPAFLAAIMVWTGYRVLFKKQPNKGKDEASAKGVQPVRN